MNFNQDEFLSQLYFDSLKQRAEIKILKGLLLDWISKGNETSLDEMQKAYSQQLPKVIESEILNSPLKDEYLHDRSEEFLKKMKEGL